uniref:Uncharacterized protein n=1 Tax=uncultured prokaryote TaxID=198431 RepID=A0A0H5Q7R4_9ZZZZ|nr:hypothetical protein [uncultured prokaryote]
MTSPQPGRKPNGFASPASATMLSLTPEEWKLILEALSAYQHREAFRALYEKLAVAQRRA